MTRWFSHTAALASLLLVPLLACAQPGSPMPVGAARIPDFSPMVPKKPLPGLVPGPITPENAPLGPPPELDLPANHISAFQTDSYPIEEAVFASIGAVSLRPLHIGRVQIGFQEVTTTDTLPQLISGLFPASARPALLDASSLSPHSNLGTRATLGYLLGNQAFELTGYYTIPNEVDVTRVLQGGLTVPFGTLSSRIPRGFEGNQNLFVNADLVRVSFANQLGNVELNYRYWNAGVHTVELIMGIRYLHSLQGLNILTDDEFLTRGANGALNPIQQATYSVSTRNNILALQFGGEYSINCPVPPLTKVLWFTGMGKVGFGPNVVDRRYKLVRGDGFQGVNVANNDFQLGQIYDLSGALDFHLLERLRLRVGYQALLLVGVSNATAQVNFDLGRQGTRRPDYGSQFFHGPMMELQFLF